MICFQISRRLGVYENERPGETPQLLSRLSFLQRTLSFRALLLHSNHADDGIPSGSENTAAEDGDTIFSADIISLEHFVAHRQSDDNGSDLWFEPEPIGAVL